MENENGLKLIKFVDLIVGCKKKYQYKNFSINTFKSSDGEFELNASDLRTGINVKAINDERAYIDFKEAISIGLKDREIFLDSLSEAFQLLDMIEAGVFQK